jgi:type II secretory pathway pseudopilin PulG
MGFLRDLASRATVTPTLRKLRAKDGAPSFVVRIRGFAFGRKADSKRSGQNGYILLAVLFLVVMVLIALAAAAPKVAADIERDREVELMHRGLQYRRAIQLYYRKFGSYPPNMDVLEKVNQIRFLRKRYLDPVTGKDEWHLIHFGENKTPTTMGFFGQPLGGVGMGGVGCGGQSVGSVTTSTFGNSSFGGSSLGGSSAGSSGFGSGGSFGGSGAGTGSVGGTGCGTSDSGTAIGLTGSPAGVGGSGSSGLTDPNLGNPGGANPMNANGTNSNSTNGNSGTGTDGSSTTAGGGTTSTNGAGTASTFGGSTLGGSGQTFGGGGIIGVESTSPKATILEYKKKKHFNEWEFVYDPIAERMTVSSSLGAVGQPMSGAGNSNPSMQSPGSSGMSGTQPGTAPPQTPTNPTTPQ